MTDPSSSLASPLDLLRQAIEDEGPQPHIHRQVMERHRREWPTLWKAIDALLDQPGQHR